MDIETVVSAPEHTSGVFHCDAVITELVPAKEDHLPSRVRLFANDGAHLALSYVSPLFYSEPGKVDIARLTLIASSDSLPYVVAADWNAKVLPLMVVPSTWGGDARLVEHTYELAESVQHEALRAFVHEVFGLKAVFYDFWTSTAGRMHHAWRGGFASHSVEVAEEVNRMMARSCAPAPVFTEAECDLGKVAALLHDIGKTVSYTADRRCTARALAVGHDYLGLELLQRPLDTLRQQDEAMADALTALLLSRTRYTHGPYRCEAIREVISIADNASARRNFAGFPARG